jgi:hypothetical protein
MTLSICFTTNPHKHSFIVNNDVYAGFTITSCSNAVAATHEVFLLNAGGYEYLNLKDK